MKFLFLSPHQQVQNENILSQTMTGFGITTTGLWSVHKIGKSGEAKIILLEVVQISQPHFQQRGCCRNTLMALIFSPSYLDSEHRHQAARKVEECHKVKPAAEAEIYFNPIPKHDSCSSAELESQGSPL